MKLNNKQFMIFALLIAMSFSIVGCGAKETFKPGTYTGESIGIKGPLKVEVTVTADEITDIKVLSHSETEGIGSLAVEELPGKIIESQSLKVEAVSGATSSSKSVIEAVEKALKQSGADIEALKK
ncbi:MAG: hypothetical protein K0Q97_1626 [Bacillota bacterium]|jgi:uncharacterized protein with FMN-binding domain|nr:hypothetical protein [Bacillota bacterium]